MLKRIRRLLRDPYRKSDMDKREEPLTVSTMARRAHDTSVAHGWHDAPICEVPAGGSKWPPEAVNHDSVAAKIALVHSEVSEALECVRINDWLARVDHGKPEGFVVELADAVIRIGDLCESLGLDLEAAIKLKMAYNDTRPHRHGGKAL